MNDAAAAAGGGADLSGAPDKLWNDLGWLLGQVQYGYLAASSAAVGALAGGLRALHVLGAAVEGEAPNQIEVARRFGIDRTVMVRVVDELERDGLVQRQPDPADRRARILAATPRGVEVHEAIQRQRDRVDQHVLAGLDPAEQAEFRRLLQSVVARLIAVDPTHGEAACQAARRELATQEQEGAGPQHAAG